MAKLSRSDVVRARGTGAVETKASATTKTRNVSAFTRKAAAMPSTAITRAAAAGPTARAMLNVIELSAIAGARSFVGTSEPTSAICAGVAKAVTTPSAAANATTPHVLTLPVHTSAASVPLIAAAMACVRSNSFRRSNASAIRPVQGASRSTGPN